MRLRFFLSCAFLLSLTFYLFANLKNLTDGSIVLWVLVINIFFATFLIINLLFSFKPYTKVSFLFLLLFFLYFIFRISLDFADLKILKAYTVATSGGIILFYFLGFSSRLAIENSFCLYFSAKHKFIFNLSLLLGFCFFSFFVIGAFLNFLSLLREDVLLIKDLDGMYQRAGDFVSIFFLYISVLYNYYLIYEKHQNKRFFFHIIRILYYTLIIIGIWLSQMIGSNKATVLLIGILILSISIDFMNSFRKYLHYSSHILITGFKSKILYRIIAYILISTFLTFLVFSVILFFYNIDISQLRIFGFDRLEITSLSSREKLREVFLEQFFHSPFFGNMNVGNFTTSQGSHAHSFILTLLSHLGLIGFIIFISYLYLTLKEFFTLKNINFNFTEYNKLYFYNNIKIFSFFLFFGVFFIASIGTFITWTPLWFVLGLIFPPIQFKKLNKTDN